jgi:hypothetical protein
MMKARVVLVSIFALLVVACDRFEIKEVVVFVSPQTAQCANGIFKSTDTCLQISENSTGPFFLNKINGFSHEVGFRYKLRVQASWQNEDKNTVGEHSFLEFLETLEKTPAQ